MEKIDINNTLLERLKTDYNNAEDQVKFMNGLDYLEAMVKLFAVVNIAVVKEIDDDIYQRVFLTNFKITPSLGDFKSLATSPFTKANKKVLLNKNSFYKSLYNIFTSKDLDLHLDMADDIIEENIKENKKKIATLCDLFNIYVVNFRNKLKGHGASFSIEDKEQSKIILDNLDAIINAIESKLHILLEDPQLSFFIEVNEDSGKEHDALKVFAQYDKVVYQLSPLMVYLKCNKFSCKDNHKVKLFFYNDGKASKSYYIDYSYNHYYYFSSNNEVDDILKEITNYQKEINAHDTSDNLRQSNLLSIFVGREKELKISQEHIMHNIASDTPSAITIKGKPGIGKSAFISKLQVELTEKVEALQTYIFYARKSEMSDDELKYFYNKLSLYLSNINISIPKQENDEQLTTKEKLEYVFETLNKELKEPMLLVIDGLDEFSNPVAFLQNFPMQNIPNKLHIVFSTRGYPNILETLQTKLFNSDFNLLNKDQYLQESISITLGKLSQYEVEILISEVLTKDIQRDTETYRTIQSEIYEKSEGLPLYIHYISNKLIELDPESSNIGKQILIYAKELPQGLDDFYFQSFNNLKTVSSQILYTLYFSHKHIGFNSFYNLLTSLNGFIDKKDFQNSYFNEIEIFLTQDTENKYGYYHLSVKEAIKNYFMQEGNLQSIVEIDYDTFLNNIPIAPYRQEQYRGTFNEYYYLKKDSDLFELLESIYTYLSDKQNDEKLSELYKDNYLTYFYRYICFSNYHKMVIFEEMLQKDYAKFENATLSNFNSSLIEKFFKAYELSPKQDIIEIKYAHEFALLANDYDRVLAYAKDYDDAFLTLFIDIIWNLDDPKNQKLFKELKPIWSKMYSGDFKWMLLENQILFNYPEYMIEIVNTIDNFSYKSKVLFSIVSKMDNMEKALEIANSIEDYAYKLEALAFIAVRTDDQKLLEKALEIANSIKSDWKKSSVLISIVEKTEDQKLLEKALEIANSIEDYAYKLEAVVSIGSKMDDQKLLEKALENANSIIENGSKRKSLKSIIDKIDDQKLLEKALEIANSMDYDFKQDVLVSIVSKMDDMEIALEIANSIGHYSSKSIALISIVEKTEDQKLLEKALEIANSIKDYAYKLEAVVSIGSKMDDQKLLEKALENANSIEDSFKKSRALVSIVSKMNDIEKALEIANTIDNSIYKSEALVSIVSRMDNIEKALEIANSIGHYSSKSIALISIVEKTEDQKLLEKALEIANTIKDDEYLSKVLISIVSKIDDQKLLEKALEISKAIKYHEYLSEALASIASKTDDQKLLEKALEIANSIDDEKLEVLVSIVSKMDNIEKALEIANSIGHYAYKSEALVSIASKTDDQKLLGKALAITNSIERDNYKSEALISIVSKIDDQKLLEKALEVANSFEEAGEKSKAEVLIASKINNIEKALEVANSIEIVLYKSEAIASIGSKMDDKNLLKKSLEILKTIKSDGIKSEALVYFVEKTEDQKLLKKALKIANTIGHDTYKSKAIASIASKMNNIEKALEIADSIERIDSLSEALVCIVSKMYDKEEALEPANTITENINGLKTFVSFVFKTDDQKLLGKALEIANSIGENEYKFKVLVSIVSKMDDVEKALEIANTIKNDEYLSIALISIVEKTEDQKLLEKALETANSFKEVWKKSEVEALIASKMNDIEKALEVANSIEIVLYKSEAIASIGSKMDDKNLLKKSLEILKTIKSDGIKSLALSFIVEKTDNQKLLEKALEIANAIGDDHYKSEVVVSIASKTDDQKLLEKALEIANAIGDDRYKSEVVVSIASKTDDQKLLEKALEIADSIEDNIKKQKTFVYIKKKYNTLSRLDNYLYKFNAALNFHLSESFKYVALYNDDTILRYYGTLDAKDNQRNDLESILIELHDIESQRDLAEESEDEELYEKLSEDAQKIKEQILEDERMLNNILQQCAVSKLAFKKKDILDII